MDGFRDLLKVSFIMITLGWLCMIMHYLSVQDKQMVEMQHRINCLENGGKGSINGTLTKDYSVTVVFSCWKDNKVIFDWEIKQ